MYRLGTLVRVSRIPGVGEADLGVELPALAIVTLNSSSGPGVRLIQVPEPERRQITWWVDPPDMREVDITTLTNADHTAWMRAVMEGLT